MGQSRDELHFQLHHYVLYLEELAGDGTTSNEVVQEFGISDQNLFEDFDGYAC